MWNWPSMSVAVPMVVPFTMTVAPITGSPSESTTVPLIEPAAAWAVELV